MDQARIQALVNRGEGIAANILGQITQVSRPTQPVAIDTFPPVATFNAYFATDPNFSTQKPGLYAHPLWMAMFDRTNTQVGDYLITADDMYFIVEQQPLLATACVLCNHVIAISRPGSNVTPSSNYYSGGDMNAIIATPYVSGFPCSLIQGTKGERTDAGLPEDVRAPWFSIMLPILPGNLEISPNDLVVDDQGTRYVVSSNELTPLGWRLTVELEGA